MTTPYDYYPVVMQALSWMASGLPESLACDKMNLDVGVFKKYISSDPVLQEMHVEADQRGTDALADALLHIDNHPLFPGCSEAKMAKVVSDNIKWLLDKRKPKKYGHKVAVDVNLTADAAIVQALAQGKARAAIASSGDVIDAAFTEVVEQTEEEMMAEMGLA